MKHPKVHQGRWSDTEHDRFVKAIAIYGSNWKAVELAVGTRSATQARSHAQKYFIREDKFKKEVEEMRKKTGTEGVYSRCTSVCVQYGSGVTFLTPKPS